MDYPEQRNKRKRFVRPPYSPKSFYLSVRSVIFFFIFLTFLYFLSFRFFSINSSNFHPVLVVSSSSSSSTHDSVKDYSNLYDLIIQDRVLFPDHVLLLLSSKNMNALIKKSEEFECIYYNYDDYTTVKHSVLSMDEYDEFRFIARCPLPPSNYSGLVSLGWLSRSVVELGGGDRLWKTNQTVHSWENVAYAATLDGGTAVVFVKGLNLRQERESDPTQYRCHFGLGKWEKGGFSLNTKAITAAQEVVRCALPQSIRKSPDKVRGIRITVGVTPHVHARAHEHILVPSVAKIFNHEDEGKKRIRKEKYELCVCTMVWNQASPLREWIMYHSWLGVEKWFIYDNNSDDGIKEVIEELEQEDFNITRHLWPWIKTQEAGFSHCALRAKDECNWVSFMDVDEFFYFPVPSSRRQRDRKLGFPGQNSLRNLVANFSSSTTIAEIRTACHSFGPSGLNSPPSQGVTVGYTCRLRSPERHKSIVRPDALDTTLLNVVHHFHLRKGFRYLNLHQTTAVINHYKYQVWEVFRAKFFRRVATYVADWQESQNEGSKDRAPGLGTEAIEPPNWRLQFCDIWDTGLRDFVLANLANPVTGFLPWERSTM